MILNQFVAINFDKFRNFSKFLLAQRKFNAFRGIWRRHAGRQPMDWSLVA